MVSRARLISQLINATGDVKSDYLDNVPVQDSAAVVSILPPATSVYSTLDSLPVSGLTAGDRAFVESSGSGARLYISNGSGWYNVALVNLSPSIDSIDGYVSSLDSGDTLTLTILASDSDNVISSYGATLNPSNGTDSGITTFSRDSSVVSLAVGSGDLENFDITFTASDGISTATLNKTFSISRGLVYPYLLSSTTYRIGTTGLTYNTGTKYEGTHSAYIAGAGSTNRQPGYGVGSATLQQFQAYTIAMWIKVSSFNGTYNVAYPWNTADKYASGNSNSTCGLSINTNGDTKFSTDKYNGSNYGGIRVTASGSSYSTGTWYHIVACANNGLFPAEPSLYISTESSFADKVDVTNTYGGTAYNRDTTANLNVGPSASTGWYLHGSIGSASDDANVYYDDVRIYIGDVTRTQAQAIYNSNGDPSVNNGQPNLLKVRYGFNNTNYSYSN